MKKTIEIDKNNPEDVHVGDMLYLNAAPDRAYMVVGVDAYIDGPYCIDLMEHLDDTTRNVIDRLGVGRVGPKKRWWVSPDYVSRITREVDVSSEWPTPEHNTAYRGADGNLYVYASESEDDGLPWMRFDDDEYMVWDSAVSLSHNHPDALPLTELVPKSESRPEIHRITDIRKVQPGFIVFAKGCRTPFVCSAHICCEHDISSPSYVDALIKVFTSLPRECVAEFGNGSPDYRWLRNDRFDYAIDPVKALGLGGGDEKC